MTDFYEPKSKLADAGIPMGATVTHIYRAKAWRSEDARNGEGSARRRRIRARARSRPDFVYVPNNPDPPKPTGTRPSSHKGRAA